MTEEIDNTANPTDSAPDQTIPDLIRAEAPKFSVWHQHALKKAVEQDEISEADIRELAANIRNADLQPPEIKFGDLASSSISGPVALESISQVKDVNILSSKETLEFKPAGITVIYGDNGSGKSGYARILKNACGSRELKKKKILSDVSKENFEQEIPSALISFAENSKSDQFKWNESEEPHKILSAVSVYDSDCSKAFMQRTGNTVAYPPFGLGITAKLSNICVRVQKYLQHELSSPGMRQNKLFLAPPWSSDSKSGEIASRISDYETSENRIEEIGEIGHIFQFSQKDQQRLEELNKTLAPYSNEYISGLQVKIRRAESLLPKFKAFADMVSDANIDAVLSQKSAADKLKLQAKECADGILEAERAFDGIGEEAWREMWRAALKYWDSQPFSFLDFPDTGQGPKCVLCHQDLDEAAQSRMEKFRDFMASKLENSADKENRKFLLLRDQALSESPGDQDLKMELENIPVKDKALLQQIDELIQAVRWRQKALEQALSGKEIDPKSKAIPIDSAINNFQERMRSVGEKAQKLSAAKGEKEQVALVAEQRDLTDRKILSKFKSEFAKEIARQRDELMIKKCIGKATTYKASTLGKQIYNRFIAKEIDKAFSRELRELSNGMIDVVVDKPTSQRGTPRLRYILCNNKDADAGLVLSEGEQNCVSLAAFLADLATCTYKSALIFDDPISSLDRKWRDKVAERLVKEAQNRQVVVLTHNSIFLCELVAWSNICSVALHCSELRKINGVPGRVLPEFPPKLANVKSLIKRLRELLRDLPSLENSAEIPKYDQRIDLICSYFREAWEKAFEEVALGNSINRNRENIKASQACSACAFDEDHCHILVEKTRLFNRLNPGHSRPIESDIPDLDANRLEEELVDLEDWIKSMGKNIQNIPAKCRRTTQMANS